MKLQILLEENAIEDSETAPFVYEQAFEACDRVRTNNRAVETILLREDIKSKQGRTEWRSDHCHSYQERPAGPGWVCCAVWHTFHDVNILERI